MFEVCTKRPKRLKVLYKTIKTAVFATKGLVVQIRKKVIGFHEINAAFFD